MLKYSIKRVILAFITAFIILTLTFFLVKSLPPRQVFSPDENVRYAFYVDQVNLGYYLELHELSPKLGVPLAEFHYNGIDYYYYPNEFKAIPNPVSSGNLDYSIN